MLRIFLLTAHSSKVRAKRMQDASAEAEALERLKQKRREEHEATSSMVSARKVEKVAQKKEKNVRSLSPR